MEVARIIVPITRRFSQTIARVLWPTSLLTTRAKGLIVLGIMAMSGESCLSCHKTSSPVDTGYIEPFTRR